MMDKNTQTVLSKAVELYFDGGDWRGYIEKEGSLRRNIELELKQMFRKWGGIN